MLKPREILQNAIKDLYGMTSSFFRDSSTLLVERELEVRVHQSRCQRIHCSGSYIISCVVPVRLTFAVTD